MKILIICSPVNSSMEVVFLSSIFLMYKFEMIEYSNKQNEKRTLCEMLTHSIFLSKINILKKKNIFNSNSLVHSHCIYLSFWFTEIYSDIGITRWLKVGLNAITVLNWKKRFSGDWTHCKTDCKQWVHLTCQNEITCKWNLEIPSQQIWENSAYLYTAK